MKKLMLWQEIGFIMGIKNFFSRLLRNKKTNPPCDIQEDVSNVLLEASLEKEQEISPIQQEPASKEIELNISSGQEETVSAQIENQDKTYHEALQSQLTEKNNLMTKLKKEKNELEDELDEKEHNLKLVSRKFDSIKKEFDEIKTAYDELKNDYTAKKQEFEKIKQDNESMSIDLGLKTKSIDIVNEILSAHDADDRDAKKIHEQVKEITNFVKIRVCEDLRSTTNLTMDFLDGIQDDIDRWGNLEQKTWLQKKIVIAFVGEFSAGKTSIVNRILSQDNECINFKLPVSATPTTAIATYISNGQDTRVQFTDHTGNLKNINFEVFNQFSKPILEKIRIAQLIQHFVIKYPNQNLTKLSILDTPGFSSNDKHDERRTIEVINEADALFWVIDVNMGEINERSLKIIKEHMKDLPLYIIINKVDTKSPNERNMVKEKIQNTMKKNSISVCEYIEFSKTETLDNIMQIISGINYRREEENEIIPRICNIIEDGLSMYNNKIKEIRKDIRKIQSKINENEKITDSFTDKRNSKIDAINKYLDELTGKDMIGNTIFGTGNKLKNPDGFWNIFNKREALYNDIEVLYNNFLEAIKKLKDDYHERSELESNLEVAKSYIKTLKNLKKDFVKVMKNYDYDTSTYFTLKDQPEEGD